MYAVIESGGKQYQVEEGDTIEVELFDKELGALVEFPHVLFVHDKKLVEFGNPFLSKYWVKGEVLGKILGPKIVGFKYKKRKNQRKKWGHRQKYLRVKITEIGAKPSPKKEKEVAAVEVAEEEKIPKKVVRKRKKVGEAEKEKKAKPVTLRGVKKGEEKKAAPKTRKRVKKEEK